MRKKYQWVRIDFYKESGKWYEGCEIMVSRDALFSLELMRQEIVDKQTALNDGWQGYFDVVMGDPEENPVLSEDTFCKRLMHAHQFMGIKRTSNEKHLQEL